MKYLILLHSMYRSPLMGLDFRIIRITTNRSSLCDFKKQHYCELFVG